MLDSFCNKVCDYFIMIEVITEDRKPLYVYGLNQAITMCLNIITTLLIGVLLDMFWFCVFFLAAFIPIRSYAGGYHSKTPLRCYIFSVLQIIAILLLLKQVEISVPVSFLLLLLACIAIFFFAPVEDANKPFSKGEFMEFRKRTRIILMIEFLCYVVCALLGWYILCESIMIAHITLAIVLILGWIKNKYRLKVSSE